MEKEEIIFTKENGNVNITKTYISKEKFVELISNLEFKYIEDADIRFITGFLLNVEENTISPKGYKIYIS